MKRYAVTLCMAVVAPLMTAVSLGASEVHTSGLRGEALTLNQSCQHCLLGFRREEETATGGKRLGWIRHTQNHNFKTVFFRLGSASGRSAASRCLFLDGFEGESSACAIESGRVDSRET